jgi:hypothetical protein
MSPNTTERRRSRSSAWRPDVEVDYDLRDLPGNQRWVFRIGVALLVPSL